MFSLSSRGSRSSAMLIIFALVSLIAHVHAASAVLGVDLGTQNIKAALVKPGIPLEIVLTKDSKRKEVAAIALKPLKNQPDAFPERVYGADAANLAARFPDIAYPNLKSLLGKPAVAGLEYQALRPAIKIEKHDHRGTVAFAGLPIAGTSEHFLVEELLAMQLQNVKDNAMALAGRLGVIDDIVITVPPFYTADERRAVELAANLAGFQVLGIVSDGLAVGINYAVHRSFPNPADGGKPEIHLVYDIGAGSAKATILQFQSKEVKDIGRFNKTIQEVNVLGAGWDRGLSGDALTEILLHHFIDEFVNSPKGQKIKSDNLKADILANGRAMAKFWKESERVRQVLSANTQTSFGVESLYDDVDFRVQITRDKFEELSASLLDKVTEPIHKALEVAKLTVSDINSIILHGGVVRTPTIQRQLEGLMKDPEKVRTNVNADEAATLGATFKGASLSKSFRVKDIRTSDSPNYAVALKWTGEGGKERSQTVFLPTSKPGAIKQIPFKKQEDFTFKLAQVLPDAASGTDLPVSILEIQSLNLTASVANLTKHYGCEASEISTKYALRISERNALPEVVYATVSCEVDADKSTLFEGVKELFGFGKKEQKPLKEAEETLPTLSESSSETSTKAEDASASANASESAKAETTKEPSQPKKKTVWHNIQLQIRDLGIPQLPVHEFKRVQDSAFDESDRTRHARDELRNTLEAFVYKALEELEDDKFVRASTEAERSALKELLESTSDWLYGDGAGAKKEDLEERLTKLQGLKDPIKSRLFELSERPQLLKSLKDALNSSASYLDVIKSYLDAAKSAAESSTKSSTTTAPSAAKSSSLDDFAELEDSTSSSSESTTTTVDVPIPTPSFTQQDLDSFGGLYEKTSAWLKEKLAEQEKLADNVDPTLLASELQQKTQEINRAFRTILERQFKVEKPKAKPKAKKSKAKKPKAKPTPKKSSPKDDEDIDVIDVAPGEDVEEAIKKFEAEKERKAKEGTGKGNDVKMEKPTRKVHEDL